MKVRTEEFTLKTNNGAWWILENISFDYHIDTITDVYFLITGVRKRASKFYWSIKRNYLWIYSTDVMLEMYKNGISVGDDIIICVNYMSTSEDRNDKLSILLNKND